MTKVAVLIETTDNKVKDANFGVLTAAREGGNEIYGFLMGADGEQCRGELEKYGVAKIVSIAGDGVDLQPKPDLQARAIIAALKEYDIPVLLGLSSSEGKDTLARVAAKLKAPLAVDCLSVDIAASTVRKPYFSGKTIATLKMNGAYFLSAIRPNAVEPVEAPVDAEVVSFTQDVGDYDGLVIEEIKKSDSGKIDLSEANVIVTGGRPIGSKENFSILEQCADAMNGAVGASRVAVDEGYAPHSIQVGQTGKIVNPRLYVACGISGSVQHFAGMKTSKVIVAINSDKDAPIFNKCDYGIIGDIFEVVPALTAELTK
ncbi:MAG: electron transfer flavoprotein subunit alpha/FixB family protein [Deltaproteobacteria bacterium]|nr:electron transfer flavoprotein subunit alpha/FixB family protein [Deltaproteobacteria bacterium]